ncbi:MAG: methionine--tRNA ligase [Mycoplasmataceae bacterium]|nr:methionine--tRNA ligase [Mycoplasmataceae bacterium]
MQKKFYITTAIHYASGKPHIGHLYEEILADSIARYKKLIGYDVYFLTGMDEHGQKISEYAEKNSMENQKWVDYINTFFVALWEKADIGYSGYIRTTNPNHMLAVQKAFTQLYKENYIYLGEWKTLYCVGCEEAYSEGEAVQKEDGLYCRVGHKLTVKAEESYFFKMSDFTQWIKEYLQSHDNFLLPSIRRTELLNNFLGEKLLDLSVSRVSFDWGIPILENKKHVMYVWLDALLNYITALGWNQDDDSLYQKYWADENSEVLHVIGKDIARFHAIYWPIFLKCLNVREPNKIIAHGFIMAEDGRKMSKTFGNVVDPEELFQEFDSDTLRYYFSKEFNCDSDNSFSKNKLVETYNSDLANIIGNLVSRFVGIAAQNKEALIKNTGEVLENKSELNDAKNKLLDNLAYLVNIFNIKEIVGLVLDFAKSVNKYIEINKPWELKKSGETAKLSQLLFDVANSIRIISATIAPILTKGTQKINKAMNFSDEQLKFENLDNDSLMENYNLSNYEVEPIYNRKK